LQQNYLLVIVFFFSAVAFQAQSQEQLFRARISAADSSVDGINIVNLISKKYARTNSEGFFSIGAQAGDLLVITAVNLEVHRYLVDADDFSDVVQISMIPKVTTLDEAVVNQYTHINAEALGIIPKGQRKYTPAERRLQTAGDFKPIHLLGILGGSLPVDPIINAITKRTAMLKKELAVETNERLLAQLDSFGDQYFTERLSISSELVDGFKRYAVEDPALQTALMTRNKEMVEFRLSFLAANYNNMRNEN